VEDRDVLLSERRASSVVLTLNRPEKLNAISSAMLRSLDGALADAEGEPSIRALVLTGAGDRAFAAGADIAEYAKTDLEGFGRYQEQSRRVFSRLDGFPKPVVAAVNGYALGGGFEIALCCDILIASRSARFGLPEGLLALSPGGGGSQRLTRATGPFVAADVLLAARQLSADDAFRLGLVSDIVEPDALLDTAVAKANAAARVAPRASRELLELIRLAGEASLEDGLSAEHQALLRLRGTADAAEGIRAFVEKREPRFTGD
jgi:enoyl-CoA hydratase